MTFENKRVLGILVGIALILVLPLIAMQITNEVNWKLGDFVIAGILLLVSGISCEIVFRKVSKKDLQIGIVAAIIIVLLLVWAELAVGIFGTPFAGS